LSWLRTWSWLETYEISYWASPVIRTYTKRRLLYTSCLHHLTLCPQAQAYTTSCSYAKADVKTGDPALNGATNLNSACKHANERLVTAPVRDQHETEQGHKCSCIRIWQCACLESCRGMPTYAAYCFRDMHCHIKESYVSSAVTGRALALGHHLRRNLVSCARNARPNTRRKTKSTSASLVSSRVDTKKCKQVHVDPPHQGEQHMWSTATYTAQLPRPAPSGATHVLKHAP